MLLFILRAAASGQTQRPTHSSIPAGKQTTSGSATETVPTSRKQGWSYDPDAGIVLQRGDFKWTSWGYGEHVFRTQGEGFWRRVRQGMEFDLPRFAAQYRTAVVYEVDFTDTNFFRDRSKLNILENLYWTVQDAEDPSKIRVLFGENTHILSREDNLSSGNLPTINRSLVLEEHGSVHSFGTQFGVEAFKRLTPHYSIAVSALDNRGSLNTSNPRYTVGNSLAVKLTGQLLNDETRGRKLSVGAGLDQTRDIRDGTWTFLSAVAADTIGTAPVSGNELSVEGEVVFTDRLHNHSYTVESEHIFSQFSKSRTSLPGGYVQGQYSVFDNRLFGDLDPFVRYDWVLLSAPALSGVISQKALRTGVNWNLPGTQKLLSFHLEYGRNAISGPISSTSISSRRYELGLELRVNVARYSRH
jgi:hypothetical protein